MFADFLSYLAVSLAVFLGLPVGVLLGIFAEEELKPGMRFLELSRHLLFFAMLMLFFILNRSWLFFVLIASLLIIMSFNKERETLYYVALSIPLFLSWLYNGFLYIAPLIMLYGLFLGSIYYYEHLKEPKKMILLGLLAKHGGFFLAGILMSFLGLIL